MQAVNSLTQSMLQMQMNFALPPALFQLQPQQPFSTPQVFVSQQPTNYLVPMDMVVAAMEQDAVVDGKNTIMGFKTNKLKVIFFQNVSKIL